MTAKECILGRRSIRKFKAEPVSHELLAQIVETASYAPSWKHTQITRYIAIEGELKERIAKEGTSIYPGNGTIISNAPILIAVTVLKTAAALNGTVPSALPVVMAGRCMMPVSHPRLSAWLPMNKALVLSFLDYSIKLPLNLCYSFRRTES